MAVGPAVAARAAAVGEPDRVHIHTHITAHTSLCEWNVQRERGAVKGTVCVAAVIVFVVVIVVCVC